MGGETTICCKHNTAIKRNTVRGIGKNGCGCFLRAWNDDERHGHALSLVLQLFELWKSTTAATTSVLRVEWTWGETVFVSKPMPDGSTVTSVSKTWCKSVTLINLSGATFPEKHSAPLQSGQLGAAGAMWDGNITPLLFSSLLSSPLLCPASHLVVSCTLIFSPRCPLSSKIWHTGCCQLPFLSSAWSTRPVTSASVFKVS